MKIEILCRKEENKEKCLESKAILEKELADYFNFLLSKITDEQIKNKFKHNFENLEITIGDSANPSIKRNIFGEERIGGLSMPRGATYIREQTQSLNENKEPVNSLKMGVYLRYNETNILRVAIHEINHALSYASEFKDVEGEKCKMGLGITEIHQDKNIDLTGDLLNESVTDAIAEYYYKEKIKGQLPYSSPYDSITTFARILLGKDLSNTDLLNAYFGDITAMNKFIKDFKDNSHIDISTLLKMDYSRTDIKIEDLYKNAIEYALSHTQNKDKAVEYFDSLLQKYNIQSTDLLDQDLVC